MTLAYFDSMSGLIPCRICAVGDWSNPSSLTKVQFTATRGPFKRGEMYETTLRRIVPRESVRRRQYGFAILRYSWPRIISGT